MLVAWRITSPTKDHLDIDEEDLDGLTRAERREFIDRNVYDAFQLAFGLEWKVVSGTEALQSGGYDMLEPKTYHQIHLDDFLWGHVVEVYAVGPYFIAAYQPHGYTPNVRQFHGWVKGKDTRHSWSTLDAALAGCIAYRHEGPNHKADGYFMRMLEE